VFARFHGSAQRNVRSVLGDPMNLTPARAHQLLTLLETHELELLFVEHAF
jgi:hypothetical protein